MKFKFDAHQEYQLQAIQAVVNLFEGQPRLEVDLSALVSGPVPAVANRLDLDEAALVDNLQSVQAEGGLPPDTALQYIEETTDLVAGGSRVRFANFSVEMETGTGKTYVELRTILELNRLYGMRKFIIVVPSIAIREGILKTLQITGEHFRALYTNLPYRYYVYDSGNLSQVRQFALSNGVEIMIMTLASFNKDMNVIKQSTDRLAGATPIHLVQATRPILILDEPQNMESRKSAQALAALNPLFALRYSATHRNPYNLVHRLTPYEAYRQGLVKRIEVAGVEEVDNANLPFLELRKIVTEKNRVRAYLAVHRRMANGTIQETVVTVKPGENLEGKTNRSDYAVFIVEEINPGWAEIRFSNGLTLNIGQSTGMDKEAIWEAQIRYTLEEHFIKQKRLHALGIKVLSLFFIDRVDNYVHPESALRLLFNRCFREVAAQYPQLCRAVWGQEAVDPENVQGSYFANRRTKAGEVVYEESVTGESQLDRQAYDLIMKDKEKLLSFGEPVAFIFSHSALREGWDNPNVFQICTLNQTASEVKKRQEIGRGVRLAVDQSGDRNHEERVNVLTVIANQSYQEYVSRLQAELDEEYAPAEQAPRPANARRRGESRLNKAFFLGSEFLGLWEAIKHKTRFQVKIDSKKLISDVVAELDKVEILPPRIQMTKVLLDAREDYRFTPMQLSRAKTMIDLAGRFPLPNLVALMEELLERATPSLRLSRKTLLEIYKRTSKKDSAVDNPQEFANITVGIIRRHLMDQLVAGIRYEKIGVWYEMTRFEDPAILESWQEYLVPAEHSLYDPVILDSGPEREFLQILEHRRDVKLYVKLPKWFTVDTPVGGYNPDWAIVIEPVDMHGDPTGEQQLYLVHETKDTTDPDKLRPDEWRRIQCGEKHFKDTLGVGFDWGPELRG